MSAMYPNRYPRYANGQLEQNKAGTNNARWFWLGVLLHLPLAIAMEELRIVSTIHALITVLVGLNFLLRDKTPERFIALCAYIAGAEVLWRMSEAGVFWEYSKLVLMAFFFLGLLKWGKGKIGLLPLAYGVPLLLSIPLTLQALSLDVVREEISFNLFGHLTLAVGLAFFSGLRLKQEEMEKILRSLALPITGIAFLVTYKIITAGSIIFNTESNFATSGGYGPNQVSAVLGLGALACWLLVLMLPNFNRDRIFLLLLSAAFILQAVFTFSRGGVFNFLLAAPLATFWLMRSSSRGMRAAFMGTILLGIAAFIFLPQMNAVTGGALEARYQDFETTGRTDISLLDIEIWKDHFLFGVGPGMSAYFRLPFLGKLVAPHTEYSRLLAEHGLAGVWTILLLAGMAVYAFFKAPNAWAKGLVVACIIWSLAEMTHAAMRIAVISFLYVLPFAIIQKGE